MHMSTWRPVKASVDHQASGAHGLSQQSSWEACGTHICQEEPWAGVRGGSESLHHWYLVVIRAWGSPTFPVLVPCWGAGEKFLVPISR